MCGGGGGGGDAAAEQRRQEEERQHRIEQGKAQLERIFGRLEGNQYVQQAPNTAYTRDEYANKVRQALGDGGTTTEERTREFTGTGRYDRERWEIENPNPNYTVDVLTSVGRDRLADLGLSDDQISGANPNRYIGMYDQLSSPGVWVKKEGTTDPIWEQQQEAYLDFAKPQLGNQYKDARKDLGFALARQGINASSTAGDRWAKLQEDYNLQQQALTDKAMGYANQAKSNIADEKQSLLTMLNSTADPGSAVSAARSAVNSLSSTPSFSPLGPLFQNATAGLAAGMQGNQQFKQNEKLNNIMYGGDPDRGSGKVVGGN